MLKEGILFLKGNIQKAKQFKEQDTVCALCMNKIHVQEKICDVMCMVKT